MRWEKSLELIELARELAISPEGLCLDDISAKFKCARRTAERMRDALWNAFPEMEEIIEGRNKRFKIRTGLDRLSISPLAEELAELETVTNRLEREGSKIQSSHLRNLGKKLKSALRQAQLVKLEPDIEIQSFTEFYIVNAGPQPNISKENLELIRQAIKSSNTIKFSYDSPHKGIGPREITPYGLVFFQFYYVIGPTYNKDEPSTWRLDRMSNLEITKTVSSPPPEFDLKKHFSKAFGVFTETPMNIELIFSKNSVKEAKKFNFHNSQVMTDLADGRLKVEMVCGGEIEICWHLFRWGADVEIIKPKKLRNKMLELLNAAHSVYS